MRTKRLAVLALCTLAAAPAACDKKPADGGAASSLPPAESSAPKPAPSSPPPAASADLASRVAGSIVVGGGAMKYLRELSDRHGNRLSSTPGYAAAAEWVEQQLKTAGADATRKEPFTMPKSWTRGEAKGRIVEPIDRPLRLSAIGWTPGTTAPLKTEVVILKDATPEKVKADAERLKGKAVLIGLGEAPWHARKKRKKPIGPALRDAGVAAVLYAQERAADGVTHAHSGHMAADLGWPYPGFDVGKEDAAMLERLAEKGTVTVELSSAASLGGPATDTNVVGEIKGRDLPNEWVVICAHLDAWDYGTGSQDNGSGVATVLEVARAIKASGFTPRRSMRFIVWGGEEQGLLGSRAYVKAHEAELGQIAAVLNTDNGAGALKGWHTEGRDDLEKALKEFSKTRLAGLGADKFDEEVSCDTDHCPFMLAGVPALNLWVDMEAQYFKLHHAPSDTFDKVDAAQLSDATAAVALTAIEIAERDEPLAPHVDRAKVAAIVKKADMLDDLVEWGMWTK